MRIIEICVIDMPPYLIKDLNLLYYKRFFSVMKDNMMAFWCYSMLFVYIQEKKENPIQDEGQCSFKPDNILQL